MPAQLAVKGGVDPAAGRRAALRAAAAGIAALRELVGGLGTALLGVGVAVFTLVVGSLCLAGIGLLLVPAALRAVHALAERERVRLSRWGPEVITADPVPARRHITDQATRRELYWVALHASGGLLLGLVGLLLPLFAVRDTTVALWWWMLPSDEAGSSWTGGGASSWIGTIPVTLLGVAWMAIVVGLGPGMAKLQAAPGRKLLSLGAGEDLSLRVAQLTSTRAAALDAHSTELRRIERALHDGSQNRLVAVAVLLGAARRELSRDPAGVDALLERAQTAAEAALSELRTVARSILPPVLADRGLAEALSGLTDLSAIPCLLEVKIAGRCAASVEATAYFAVAEALTNATRYSQAHHISISLVRRGDRLVVSITDDGIGGADKHRGSGLIGIHRRAQAHDGTFTLSSPPGGPTTLVVELPCA